LLKKNVIFTKKTMDSTKKHQRQGEYPMPNLGQLIYKVIKQKGLSIAEVARRLGVQPNVVSQYTTQATVQTAILWKLSIALEYNFLGHIMDQLPEKTLNSFQSSFQKTIQNQENEILDLKKQIDIYKEILIKR